MRRKRDHALAYRQRLLQTPGFEKNGGLRLQCLQMLRIQGKSPVKGMERIGMPV